MRTQKGGIFLDDNYRIQLVFECFLKTNVTWSFLFLFVFVFFCVL